MSHSGPLSIQFEFEKKYTEDERIKFWPLFQSCVSENPTEQSRGQQKVEALDSVVQNRFIDFSTDASEVALAHLAKMKLLCLQIEALQVEDSKLKKEVKGAQQRKQDLVDGQVKSLTTQYKSGKTAPVPATNGNGHAPTDTNGKKAKKSGSCNLL
jgi:hypothetical protein